MDVKKVAITILCILVMGGIGFGGYKLGEKKGREEIPNEIIVINSPRVEDEIVEEEIKAERVVNEELLASENTLKSKNNEYKMWIQMPNTNINYPVMQGPDNDIYLSTDFNGDYYYPGSIFIDYRNDIENDNNLWIFGHNMADGSMFADLVKLKDETFDIVLLFGPTYHLFSHEDKLKAITEAKRVCKTGGHIFIMYLMNEYAVITYAFKDLPLPG